MKRIISSLALVTLGCSAPGGDVINGPRPGGGAGQRLTFAVVGDVRPAEENDSAQYPAEIVAANFTLMQANGAQLVIGTGDYMFASTTAAVATQIDQLLAAEANFAGPVYHAMGNHECRGATASNCPRGDETANVRSFMSRLLPRDVTTPFYRVDLDTPFGKAKLVLIAANAWSDTQATWLETQLAQTTPFTFIVRHEPAEVSEAPGVDPSEAIIARHPYTLVLLGHSHRYRRLDARHLISGNGGAPLTGHGGFGFVLIRQQRDGRFTATEIDEATGHAVDTWTVGADDG
jgi:hypothetical protein